MSPRQRPGTSGFTLAEILMVVIILGISAAVVIPQLSSRDDLKVGAAARVVMADLVYAQNRAAAVQTTQYVSFTDIDTSTAGYGLSKTLPINSDADYLIHPVDGVKYIRRFSSNGTPGLRDVKLNAAQFNDTYTAIGFDSLGVPWAYDPSSGAGTQLVSGVIQLTCGDVTLWICIEPFTGEISVRETAP